MRHLLIACFLLVSCAAPKSPAPNTATADKSPAETKELSEAKEAPGAKEESKKASDAAPSMAPKPNLTDPQIANAGITLGKADIKGSLSSNEIAGTFEKSKAGLEFCYDEARQNNPTLAGKAKLIFVIGADGSASNVEVKESGSRELDQCIEKKISQMKFPASPDKTEVSYPLVFTVK
jgi:outer membrane biosynthesis protein TonB